MGFANIKQSLNCHNLCTKQHNVTFAYVPVWFLEAIANIKGQIDTKDF